jgi:hypothetical protein
MGLNEDVKKKINNELDFDSEGRIAAVSDKVNVIDCPILIIGLGGTGVDSVLRVKKNVYDRMNVNKKGDVWKDKPDNVEYLVFDTDDANKERNLQGVKFNQQLEETFILQPYKLEEILSDKEKNLRKETREWISNNIDTTQILHGAGGVRQIGRLMLFLNSTKIVSAIEAKILRIIKANGGYDNSVPIHVYVFTGIGGGTGSGSFIDISYIIRALVNKPSIGRMLDMTGIIYLPDVNVNKDNISDIDKLNIKRNGFAALKELDYLMNLEKTGDRFKQVYGQGIEVNTQWAPYDTCILISTKDRSGKQIDRPYEYALRVATESVVNFIASEASGNTGSTTFTVNSFFSNAATRQRTFMNNLGNNRKPVNYLYSIVGSSSACLPMDDVLSYLVYVAFKEIDEYYDRLPNEQDVDYIIKYFNLKPEDLESAIFRAVPRLAGKEKHTYDTILRNSGLVIADFEGHFTRQKEWIDNEIDERLKKLKLRIDDEQNPINDMFKDITKGPIYAQRALYNTGDCVCVTDKIKTFSNKFLAGRPDGKLLQASLDDSNRKLQKLANKGIIESKKKLREEFMEASTNYFDLQLKDYLYEKIAFYYQEAYSIVLDKNNLIYDSIADLLRTLKKLFDKYGAIKTEAKEEISESGRILSWNLIETPDFIKELDKRMSSDENLASELRDFVLKFYIELFENVESWTGRSKEDLVNRLNRFISNSFASVLQQSIEYYLNIFAMEEGKSFNNYISDIIDELVSKSNVMFPIKPAINGLNMNFPEYSYVSIPKNAQSIEKAAKAKIGTNAVEVKKSDINDKIYMLHLQSGVPLYAYDELPGFENVYEIHLEAGVHLYEADSECKLDWSRLPSPYSQSEWISGHHIERENKINNEYKSIFDKAMAYGYILNINNVLKCVWGKKIDAYEMIKKFGINLESDMNDINTVQKAIASLKESVVDESRLTQSKDLYDKHENIDGTLDLNFSKQIFIKMVYVRDEIKAMVEDHEVYLDVLNKLGRYDSIAQDIRDYIKCKYTETISKRRGEYVYYDGDEVLQTLANLQGTENNYPEFYLLSSYLKLDSKLKNLLVNRSIKKEKASSDEEYESSVLTLKNYLLECKDIVKQLNNEWKDVVNGKQILDMYKMLQIEAEADLKGK